MKAAIYCRLSKEDEDKIGESESIQNQKSMLLQYALENGFDIYQIYSDEDYSGIGLLQFRHMGNNPDHPASLRQSLQRLHGLV